GSTRTYWASGKTTWASCDHSPTAAPTSIIDAGCTPNVAARRKAADIVQLSSTADANSWLRASAKPAGARTLLTAERMRANALMWARFSKLRPVLGIGGRRQWSIHRHRLAPDAFITRVTRARYRSRYLLA